MRPTRFKGRQNHHGRKVEKMWRKLPDNCAICHGKRGGVRGNENIIGGVVMCDYCHAETMK